MKRIMYLLLVLLAAGCARPVYKTKSDAETAYMHGHIKKIKETRYDNPPESGELPHQLREFDVYTEVDYNRAGNITRMESFGGPDSIPIAREEYVYDPSGEKMMSAISYNPVKNSMRIIEYEYDGHGNLLKETETTGSYTTFYSHDRKGYPRQEILNISGKDENVVTKHKYNFRGWLRKSEGVPVMEYFYYPDGTVSEIRTGPTLTERFDRNGNLNSLTLIVKYIKKPGERGKGSTTKTAETITAEYEYDTSGNWRKRTLMHEGDIETIIVREIEYY